MNKALFLDRDGTINVDSGYTYKCEDLQFIEGMPQLIRQYNELEYLVVVITNQSGIARGFYTEKDVRKFHDFMNIKLKKYCAHIDAFYYCPHHPVHGIGMYKKDCDCRKPKTGMIIRAVQDLDIDLSHSILIGDKESDRECGSRVGINKFIFVSNVL